MLVFKLFASSDTLTFTKRKQFKLIFYFYFYERKMLISLLSKTVYTTCSNGCIFLHANNINRSYKHSSTKNL